jgi:hypothetical protein
MAAMFPIKHSAIFRSRWMALIWAAGIIWVAYDIAESAPKSSPTGNSAADQATADDTNKVAEVFNGL